MLLLINISKEMLFFFNEVSVYLIFGLFIAGVLHVIFPDSIIRRHLGKNSFGSVVKSTLFGIPLPLCSCGVVPVAASLRNSGASKGASISFLIATPQIGADSFLVTYALLGWIFGVFRIVASLITAITAGVLVNIITKKDKASSLNLPSNKAPSETFKKRLTFFFSYLEYDLLGSIAGTLIVGIVVAGAIGVIIPDGFFEKYIDYPFISMIIMLVVGIPLYVCASASTPIAASLVMKGLSPGAALVFLLTGPATNAITISTVIRTLGKKSAAVYLLSIGIISLLLGFLLNAVTARYGFNKIIMIHQHDIFPAWLKVAGSVALASMLGWYYLKTKLLTRSKETAMANNQMRLNVEGMTCMHCAGTVKKAVESVKKTSDVVVDLKGKYVTFCTSDHDNIETVKNAIISAGFHLA
jgi:uncharacterized membrane protein YraQ (UPF0718 family)/copper chaperone CopZ